MKFQQMSVPLFRNKTGETPWYTDKNIKESLLNKHMTPKGKVGLIEINKGAINFVWEDDLENVLTCDKSHPIVIEPERFHHLIITGSVEFKIEFYKDVSSSTNVDTDGPEEYFTKEESKETY